MSEAIFVEGLSKAYNGKTVVDHLSFCVKRGTVFGLLGANGAGKSTTIECMLGTKQEDSGTVRLLGQDLRKKSPHAVSAHRRAVSGGRLSQRNQGFRALRRNGLPLSQPRRLA